MQVGDAAAQQKLLVRPPKQEAEDLTWILQVRHLALKGRDLANEAQHGCVIARRGRLLEPASSKLQQVRRDRVDAQHDEEEAQTRLHHACFVPVLSSLDEL